MSCCQESVLENKDNNVGPVWKNTQIVENPPNPWNRTKVQEESKESNLSFRDLMSEDLAKTLQQREEAEMFPEAHLESSIASSTLSEPESTTDTSNDFMLAYLLQQSYNKEHDTLVEREENHFNKNSKLSVSFKNYKVSSEYLQDDDSDEDEQIDDENRAVDKFEESKRTDPVIPACGYIRHNNQMITKHDKTLTGRRNAEKVMNFPPGFNTGDGGGFDMQISNKVYNKLQRTANEKDRKHRIRDKVDKATSIKAFDTNSRLLVFKLLGSSVLENLNEIISTGKESIVVHAYGGTYEEEKLPDECAIKVFKTTLTDFKTREKYIRNDYRFKDRMSKNNNKMTIQLWAEKEFHNLRRLQKAKIPSPKPFLVKNHVLLMSFLGNDSIAAPKLKNANLSYKEWGEAYKQVVDIMTKMFHSCRLIHGDMSEYNILWHENKCWVIDVSQAVEPTHPHALHFFYRDCRNIVNFFKSKGIPDILSPLELFNNISGINLCGSEDEVDILIEEYESSQKICNGDEDGEDKFEFFWNESNNEKLSPPLEKIIESNNDLTLPKEPSSKNEDPPVEIKKKTKKGKKKKNKIENSYNFVWVSTSGNETYPTPISSKDVVASDD